MIIIDNSNIHLRDVQAAGRHVRGAEDPAGPGPRRSGARIILDISLYLYLSLSIYIYTHIHT